MSAASKRRLALPIAVAALLVAAGCKVEVNINAKGKGAEAEASSTKAEPAAKAASGEASGAPRGGFVAPSPGAPVILNRDEVVNALEREYPPLLREAGIGGTVVVRFHIDENGVVEEPSVDRSSGYVALDQAAVRVRG